MQIQATGSESGANRMNGLHPAVLLYAWICSIIAMQKMAVPLLAVSAFMFLSLAFLREKTLLMRMFRRSRWLILSMLVIYSITGVMDLMAGLAGGMAELGGGIADGLIQVMRLLAVLASLAVFTGHLGSAAMVDGLYKLLAPLAYAGVDTRKFVLRLMLTMRQVEGSLQESADNRRLSLKNLFQMPAFGDDQVEYVMTPLCLRDWLVFLFIILILIIYLW